MNFSEFQNAVSSEKITLAILEASKRLVGWVVHSGDVYKLENIPQLSIVSLEDSGVPYTSVIDLSVIAAGSFFYDRASGTLYLQSLDNSQPNSRYLVLTQRLHFSSAPVTLPDQLSSGEVVYWEPMIKSTSNFGVEIDTINQTSQAIEGSGTLTLHNDQEFWAKQFDRLYFENKSCTIFVYNRELDPSDSRLIYSGLVEKKSYSPNQIVFSLKDILSALRSPVPMPTIGELGLRTGNDINEARQRLILGRVYGHLPVNVDRVLEGYPVTGTVSVSFNSATLTGSTTQFLKELSPDDRLVLNGVTYTVGAVASNTSLTLTENFSGTSGLSGASAVVIPSQPKRWMNRVWKIAGHSLRQPVTAVANGSSIIRLIVDDTTDIYTDDWIYVGVLGSGELHQVLSTTGTRIVNLRTSLAAIPTIGTPVTRIAVQNVRIDDVPLVFERDYTLDPVTATLTLLETAESNASPIRTLTSNLVFNSTRTVTGTGLKTSIRPGYMVGVVGNANFFEVLSVDSDTQLTLRTAATFTSTAIGRYKPLILDPSENVLSLDVLGKTEDGTPSGALMKTAPAIVRGMLIESGLQDRVHTDSFHVAEIEAPMHVGLVYPRNQSDKDAPLYRDIINDVNVSVFGSLIQTSDFELAYNVIQPVKSATIRLDESDILTWNFESTAEQMVKTSVVRFQRREHDYLAGQESFLSRQKTSAVSAYITKSNRERTFETVLVSSGDAERYATRWAFILEHSSGRAKINTKLQTLTLEIGSVIEVEHRKLFERMGLTSRSRLFLVESVKKSGTGVQLEVVDLSNAFARVAAINTLTSGYEDSSNREKLFGGFITDDYGLISNDPESFSTNLIW